jgi:2-polyprenyl-3-methyl-5-hydroxy-6-metoxy-1,4-benzoquinol methylase
MKVRHSYDVRELEHIYTNGYRSREFRGGSIEQEFQRILSLPYEESENKQRCEWVGNFIQTSSSVLDVGAGLGVFLQELAKTFWTFLFDGSYKAIEPNKDSAIFINDDLDIQCIQSFYKPGLYDEQFDWITCIHVLEHQQDPEQMLMDFHKDLKPNGKIYIEVPDATEFNTLDTDHDEFNSTHLHFFTLKSLCTLVESCEYKITNLKRVHHKARNLERIMMVAELCNQ